MHGDADDITISPVGGMDQRIRWRLADRRVLAVSRSELIGENQFRCRRRARRNLCGI